MSKGVCRITTSISFSFVCDSPLPSLKTPSIADNMSAMVRTDRGDSQIDGGGVVVASMASFITNVMGDGLMGLKV